MLKLLLQAALETSRNQKKVSKIKKKQKNQSGQQNVYMIPEHCPRIFGFLVFFDFSRFFLVLDKIFRFLDVFFRFWDRSLTSARGVRWRTVCMIPAHCPRIFRFLDVFSGFGQEPDICKGGGKVENCLHDTSTLSQNPFFSSVLARMQQN